MKKIDVLTQSRLISINIKKPNCMPPSLWIEDIDHPYRKGFRNINSFKEYKDTSAILHIIPYSENIKKLGRKIWVCLDAGNGDSTFYFGKIYIWAFVNKKDALRQYLGAKNNPKKAQLYYPKKYLVIDRIDLK